MTNNANEGRVYRDVHAHWKEFYTKVSPVDCPLMTIFAVSGVSCVVDTVPAASQAEQVGVSVGVKGSRNGAHFLGCN